MMPGINPRQMRQAMKQLGIKQEDIDAKQVIIKLENSEIIIDNPSVQKVNMMGQWSYQITGSETIRKLSPSDFMPEISEEDISTVMEKTGCSRKEAEEAIKEAKGDLAEAILNLMER